MPLARGRSRPLFCFLNQSTKAGGHTFGVGQVAGLATYWIPSASKVWTPRARAGSRLMATCSMRERTMHNGTTRGRPASVTDRPLGNGGSACDSLIFDLPPHIGAGIVTGLPGTIFPVDRRLHGRWHIQDVHPTHSIGPEATWVPHYPGHAGPGSGICPPCRHAKP